MKHILIHCPMCKEKTTSLVDGNGATICLTCGTTQYVHPSRYMRKNDDTK